MPFLPKLTSLKLIERHTKKAKPTYWKAFPRSKESWKSWKDLIRLCRKKKNRNPKGV